jgi:hypothetical protein
MPGNGLDGWLLFEEEAKEGRMPLALIFFKMRQGHT